VDTQTILVVGATGMLGEPVARRLLADGFRVRVLARSPERARQKLGDGFDVVQGDVEQPESLRAAVEHCDAVHINLSGGPRPEDYDRIEHRGTVNVVEAAAGAGVRRLSYLSGASVSEGRTWFPSTGAKFRAEQAIRASGVSYSIYRATWFMESLPLFVRGNKAVAMGKQRHAWRWVAADDYARMVSTALRVSEARDKVFYILGPEAFTFRLALERYCELVRPDVVVSSPPLWFLAAMGLVTRNAALSDVVRLMRYFEKVPEGGDPAEANAVLGAPMTTLAQWCGERKGKS